MVCRDLAAGAVPGHRHAGKVVAQADHRALRQDHGLPHARDGDRDERGGR